MPFWMSGPEPLGAAVTVATPSSGPWHILRLVWKKGALMVVQTWDGQALSWQLRRFDSGGQTGPSTGPRKAQRQRRRYDSAGR